MAEWMLTDEELMDAEEESLNELAIMEVWPCDDVTYTRRAIAKAQARKLVEDEDNNGLLVHRGERPGVCDSTCPACNLRKEVGLE